MVLNCKKNCDKIKYGRIEQKRIYNLRLFFHLLRDIIMCGGEDMPKKRKGEKDMAAVIERIVEAERSDTDSFIKIQKKRLRQLQAIQRRDAEGKNIKRKSIILELQASGILDESGNLAEPYSGK